MVYAGFSYPPDLNTTLHFYDVATLESNGEANVTGVQLVTDPSIIYNFQAGLTRMNLNNWTISPILLTLDFPVNLTNLYAIIESVQVGDMLHPPPLSFRSSKLSGLEKDP